MIKLTKTFANINIKNWIGLITLLISFVIIINFICNSLEYLMKKYINYEMETTMHYLCILFSIFYIIMYFNEL
jgi:hypothetical protein